jgi:thiamine-monophosphate kinase
MKTQAAEFNLIEKYFLPLSKGGTGAFNLKDDAASLDLPANQSLIVTTDALVENVHFLSSDSPKDIAAKLLSVNLSDLAAMGAKPLSYNLILGASKNITERWIKSFSDSLATEQRKYSISLIGGDTVRSNGPLFLGITAMGFLEKGTELRRFGAKFTDDIWVSGVIGDAAAGLKIATGELGVANKDYEQYLLSKYRKPIPRIDLGLKLKGIANATIDVSDGLISDLAHICRFSKLGANVFIESIPISEALVEVIKVDRNYYELVLNGGDDFELLFTADKSSYDEILSISNNLGVPITKIGELNRLDRINILDSDGVDYNLKKFGYSHF